MRRAPQLVEQILHFLARQRVVGFHRGVAGHRRRHAAQRIGQTGLGRHALELTRHGKTVAVVQPPTASPAAPTLEDWVGSGKGTVTFAAGYDPAAPAFDPEDWES